MAERSRVVLHKYIEKHRCSLAAANMSSLPHVEFGLKSSFKGLAVVYVFE